MPGAVLGLTCRTRQTRAWGQMQVAPLRGPGSAEGTTMQELRLVAVSEDGSYAVLAVPGRGGRFSLPIDDRLRTVARGQFSRLAQYDIEVESPLRPKEIQDRIRAGETADEIADAAGIPIERVRRFEGPVLAERAYRAQEAQQATVRGAGDAGPGPRLGEIVSERLIQTGTNPDDARGPQAPGRQLASAVDVHYREPAADGRVGVRPAAAARQPGRRQRRPALLSGSTCPPGGWARPSPRPPRSPRSGRGSPPTRAVVPGRALTRSLVVPAAGGPATAPRPRPRLRPRLGLAGARAGACRGGGRGPGGRAAGRARCGPGPGSAPGPEGRGRPVPPGVGAVLGRDHAGHVPPAGLSGGRVCAPGPRRTAGRLGSPVGTVG